MRRTARPLSLGSAIEVVTDVGHNRPAGPFGCRVAAANAGDPDDLRPGEDYGPAWTDVSGYARVRQEVLHLPRRKVLALPGDETISRPPCTDEEWLVPWKVGTPRIAVVSSRSRFGNRK